MLLLFDPCSLKSTTENQLKLNIGKPLETVWFGACYKGMDQSYGISFGGLWTPKIIYFKKIINLLKNWREHWNCIRNWFFTFMINPVSKCIGLIWLIWSIFSIILHVFSIPCRREKLNTYTHIIILTLCKYILHIRVRYSPIFLSPHMRSILQ